MSNHPLNLLLRFLLELAALYFTTVWAWYAFEGWQRWVMAILCPILLAALWGIFRVEGDPGKAPVPVSGRMRLLVEAFVFGNASWMLYVLHRGVLFMVFVSLLLIHYALSYDRLIRFWKKK
jgi:hypothetical protein